MNRIEVIPILRSCNRTNQNKVLSTFIFKLPRSIWAEVLTHRVFSRNSASSRAIPIEKMIKFVINEPFVPIYWGQNQKGMQAKKEISKFKQFLAKKVWNTAKWSAISLSWLGFKIGIHKQIINRLLEPFMYHTVLVSSTEWSNFLALRDHPDAEPHIQYLAKLLRKELNRKDNIQYLNNGEYHLPFISQSDFYAIKSFHTIVKKSIACCASVSYKTVDDFDMTPERAEIIYDKLISSIPIHASPTEHIAYADRYVNNEWSNSKLHGNFVGFCQFRKQLNGENQ